MKKIITIISILTVILFSATAVMADASSDLLTALDVLPEINIESDEHVTRAEFAYTVAKIMGSGTLEPVNTAFSDVLEDNIYSGYINYLSCAGIISGTSETTFSPDDKVTQASAYTILVKCMGYDQFAIQAGGYPEGYETLAMQLGITKGMIVKDGFLTAKGLAEFIGNVIEVEYAPSQFSEERTTILSNKMEIDGYDAVITEVNNENKTVTAKIEKNLYNTNQNLLAQGNSVTYKYNGKVDINHFENAPVKLYTDSEENVVAMLLQRDVEVFYGTIYSVNGDSDTSNSYAPQYIQSICLEGDRKKYEMAQGSQIEYNEQQATSPIPLTGNFAKVIIKDSEILHISAWDLAEGGIITSVTDEEISYIKGSNAGARIKDFDKYPKKLIFVDGESTDAKLLKKDTYFDWFSISEDVIVIVASEKVITDVLYSYSSEDVSIGDAYYDTHPQRFYMAEENGVYRNTRILRSLSGSTVTAHFDYAGRCVYIKLYAKDGPGRDEFLAVIDKFKIDEDNDTENAFIWVLEPSVELVSYPLAKRVTYNDGLTLDTIKGKCQKIDGSGIYAITLNKKGQISAFSKPTDLPGFTSSGTITSVTNSDNVYVNVDGKTIFLKQAENMIAIYTENSEFKVKTIKPESLKATSISGGATLKLYGEEDVLGIKLAVLCGAGLSTLKYSEYTYGVVSGKTVVLNEDDEIMYELDVVGKSKTKIVVDETLGATIPNEAFVIYNESAAFTDNGLIMHTIVDMTGNQNEWTESGVLIKDTIKQINDNMVMFGSGEAYFLNPTYSTFVEIDNSGIDEPEAIKPADIDVGDTVYYYATAEIRAMLVVR